MKFAIPIVIVCLYLISCNPGVEVDNIPVPNLYSVSSVISPRDSSLKVILYRSSGLSERIPVDSLVERNARITISDGTKEAVLKYYPATQRYECLNPFHDAEDGTVFTLTITTPNRLVLTATTALPPKPKLVSFDINSRNGFEVFKIVWDNTAGHRFFQAWRTLEGRIKNGTSSTTFLRESYGIQLEPEVFFWDKQPPGRNVIKDSIFNVGRIVSARASFTLANVNEDWWKFTTTTRQYSNWLSNAEESTIVPIFKEPARVYTNIQGGFGIFSSYNCTDSLKVNIPLGK